MVTIWLRGTAARVWLLIIGVGGFVLAMGDVLDIYDALWKFTVPATLVYGALLWRFALAPAKDEPRPQGAGAWAVHLVVKTLMTLALILGTLGVIGLAYDLYGLVLGNWPYIVLAIGLLAVVMTWSTLAAWGRARKRRSMVGPPAAPLVGQRPRGPDDLVS